jgi:hypothetical protein
MKQKSTGRTGRLFMPPDTLLFLDVLTSKHNRNNLRLTWNCAMAFMGTTSRFFMPPDTSLMRMKGPLAFARDSKKKCLDRWELVGI